MWNAIPYTTEPRNPLVNALQRFGIKALHPFPAAAPGGNQIDRTQNPQVFYDCRAADAELLGDSGHRQVMSRQQIEYLPSLGMRNGPEKRGKKLFRSFGIAVCNH